MAQTTVLGMQWGDEGKGKIVDLVCPAFDAVVRFQGGHNAGHTVKFRDRHFALHLLPSGIVHEGLDCVLGNGMVISPEALFREIDGLEGSGVEPGERLHIAERAHAILPLHAALDQAREASRGAGKIGTTARGIGPCYEAKAARVGLRLVDLDAPDLRERLERLRAWATPQLAALGADEPASVDSLEELCRGWAERLKPWLCDTTTRLHEWMSSGRQVLFEGAQGALLDLDHGTFPYVTSSTATAGGVASGAGVAPTRLDGALGVIKAYTTRVGSGPFPTELHDAVGEHLRERGNEFGTSTGRPRRCGWFDGVAARYSQRLSGIEALAVTKLDVLDEVEEIRVCVGYRLDGEEIDTFPARADQLERVEPIYRTVPGWQQSTVGALSLDDLPRTARDYLDLLEDLVGAPIALISTGPRREETLLVPGDALDSLLGERAEAVLVGRGA